MTAALDPEHALVYLRLLSTDIRAAAVIGADDRLLAGDAALAAAVVRDGRPDPGTTEGPNGADGTSIIAASSGYFTLALDVGPHGLPGLLAHDMRRTLESLG